MIKIEEQKQVELISKFAKDCCDEIKEEVSKFADEIDAASLDSGAITVSKKFTEMIRLVKPSIVLEEKGIVRVQEVEDNTDQAIFAVQVQQSFTWTEFDVRGSEVSSLAAGSGSFQSYTAPAYMTIVPSTRTTTLFIHDNIRLVNPVRMAEIMAQVMEEIKSAKENAAYSTLATTGSYTASVTYREASGYTTMVGSYVVTGSVLTPSDLVAAIKDLKTSGNRKLIPDVALMATEQKSDLETHSDMSPGQSSNANFKKAVYDENGNMVRFAGLDIVEATQMPQVTTGYFTSVNGHYCYVGKKGLILGRGEHTKRNKVETFRDPKKHGTEITIDVSYKHGILYNKSIRAICCADT